MILLSLCVAWGERAQGPLVKDENHENNEDSE